MRQQLLRKAASAKRRATQRAKDKAIADALPEKEAEKQVSLTGIYAAKKIIKSRKMENRLRVRSGTQLTGLSAVYRRRLVDHLAVHFPPGDIELNTQKHLAWVVSTFQLHSRHWAFHDYAKWIRKPTSRVYWVKGPTGVGKTQFLVQLCAKNPKRFIVGQHFCGMLAPVGCR